MAHAPPTESRTPWWRSTRAIAIAAVALVHLTLIGFILWSQQETIALPPLRREVFLLFHPKPTPSRLPVKIEPPIAAARPQFQPFRLPPSHAITLPPTAINPLELSLFHCAPENLANLTPAERLHCGQSYTQQAFAAPIPGLIRDRARDAERWQAALVARDTPVEAPCASVERFEVDAVPPKSTNAVMVDPVCVLKQIADGLPE